MVILFWAFKLSLFVIIHLPVASGSWGRESCLFSLKYRMAVVGIISTLGGCEDLGCCETKVCGVRAMCKLCIIRAL
jgi:hypothetical protein